MKNPVPQDFIPDNPEWQVESVSRRGLRVLEVLFSIKEDHTRKDRRQAEEVVSGYAEYILAYGHGVRNYLSACFLAMAGCKLPRFKNSPYWLLAGQMNILSVFLHLPPDMKKVEQQGFFSLILEIVDEIKKRDLAIVPELAGLSEKILENRTPEELTYSIEVTTRFSMPDYTGEIRNITDRQVRSLGFDNIFRVAVTDEEFLAGLNLELPGMEKIKECAATGDIPAVREAYVDYVISTKNWELIRCIFEKESKENNILEADEIYKNIITIRCHNYFKHDFDKDVNWSVCLKDDFETNVSLNNHSLLGVLARAYLLTGEEKYAEHLIRHFLSWRRQSPVPHYDRTFLQWRRLEVGSRPAFAWLMAFSALSASDSIKKDELFSFCKSYLESGRFLLVHLSAIFGNHMQVETCGLAVCGLLFPEFKESQRFCEIAFRRLSWSCRQNFFPDGFQKECSTGYHFFPVSAITSVYAAAKAMEAELPEDVVKFLRKACEVLIYLSKPDFTLPLLGDCEPGVLSRIDFAGVLSLLFKKPELKYIAAKGIRGEAPSETSFAFPYAGYYVMRDRWEKDGQYLVFDAGCFGTGHQHDDKLSFEMHAFGRTLIIDPGINQYRIDEFEPYFRGTIGYNSILIDGKGQHRRLSLPGFRGGRIVEPTPDPDTRWFHSEFFDYCEGWYKNGYASRTLPPFNVIPGMRESDLATLERGFQHRRRIFK